MLSMRAELLARLLGEGFEVAHARMQGFLIVGHQLVDVLQGGAHSLADILNSVRVSGQRRDAVLSHRHATCLDRTALQRHRRHAREAGELQADQRVLPDRRGLVDVGDHHHALGIVELDGRDFADLDAVEIDVAAGPQARGRALEDDAQRGALGSGAEVLEPENKAERGCHDSQRKRPDQDEIRLRFHQLNSKTYATTARARLP